MVAVAGQAVVAVLTRAPSAGGKSRLFAELRRPIDRDLLEALLLDTLDAVRAPGVRRVVFLTPSGAEEELRAIVPADVGLFSQRGDALGARMRAAFDDLFAAGARAVTLVGSDLPLLDSQAVVRAHEMLAARPDHVVIGPTEDGGYYLVGATRTPAAIFDDVAWSTASVLDETRRLAAEHHLTIEYLPTGTDVDTVADLRRAAAAEPSRAVRTRAWARRARL